MINVNHALLHGFKMFMALLLMNRVVYEISSQLSRQVTDIEGFAGVSNSQKIVNVLIGYYTHNLFDELFFSSFLKAKSF